MKNYSLASKQMDRYMTTVSIYYVLILVMMMLSSIVYQISILLTVIGVLMFTSFYTMLHISHFLFLGKIVKHGETVWNRRLKIVTYNVFYYIFLYTMLSIFLRPVGNYLYNILYKLAILYIPALIIYFHSMYYTIVPFKDEKIGKIIETEMYTQLFMINKELVNMEKILYLDKNYIEIQNMYKDVVSATKLHLLDMLESIYLKTVILLVYFKKSKPEEIREFEKEFPELSALRDDEITLIKILDEQLTELLTGSERFLSRSHIEQIDNESLRELIGRFLDEYK